MSIAGFHSLLRVLWNTDDITMLMQYHGYVERIVSANSFIAGIKSKTSTVASWTTRLVTVNGLSPENKFPLSSLLPDGTHITLTRRLSADDDVDRWCCDVELPDGSDLLDSLS